MFWETEPGTEICPQSELPDPAEGLDDPEVFAGFLDAVRWGEPLDAIGVRIEQPHLFERMARKDLYVTEAIRHAVVPSEIYPDARVVSRQRPLSSTGSTRCP